MAPILSGIVAVWLLLCLAVTAWYMPRNLIRFYRTMRRTAALGDDFAADKHFAITRYRRYLMLCGVWLLVALGGLLELRVPDPIVPEVYLLVRIALPTIATLTATGIAHLAYREHADYHDGTAILFRQSLRLQAQARQLERQLERCTCDEEDNS